VPCCRRNNRAALIVAVRRGFFALHRLPLTTSPLNFCFDKTVGDNNSSSQPKARIKYGLHQLFFTVLSPFLGKLLWGRGRKARWKPGTIQGRIPMGQQASSEESPPSFRHSGGTTSLPSVRRGNTIHPGDGPSVKTNSALEVLPRLRFFCPMGAERVSPRLPKAW